MPSGSDTAGRSAGRPATRAPASERYQLLILATAVGLVLVGATAAAVHLSESNTSDSANRPQASPVIADGNRTGAGAGAGAGASPGATPPASRQPARTGEPPKTATTGKSTDAPNSEPTRGQPNSSPGFTPNPAEIPGTGRVYLGAAGDSPALSYATGLELSDHAYAFFSGNVPIGRMITVKVNNADWRSVAAAGPGSAIHDDIVRWAQTIKARGDVIMLAYHHEPEGANSAGFGTPAEFIQAWRTVVTTFRAQGVRNVIYTWQMTAWAFRTLASDPRSAARWYPGDAYVDSVGADAYNWSACGEGSGNWEELQTLGDPVLAFARSHGKQASFPEFASDSDPRRPQWIYNALEYIASNRSSITGAFYFHRPPTVAANSDCKWPLLTVGDYQAYAALGRNRDYFIP